YKPFSCSCADRIGHGPAFPCTQEYGPSKEVASRKGLLLNLLQPTIAEMPYSFYSFRAVLCRKQHLVRKDFSRSLNRRQFKRFLGAEMSKKAAFAHLQISGQPPNGESRQTLCRSNLQSARDNRLA